MKCNAYNMSIISIEFIFLFQDYMDRVTLSQAVNSICGPESSSNYMNIDNDLMYMDQTVSSNVLDPTIAYTKEHSIGNETITSYANTNPTSSAIDTSAGGISTAMSQYVNALKNAGLPTDLPILFESGDGSYINVNEQVLLDMVQSSEIQYEVIEQPNIIEKVADPSEIKSIDDLSKSIERGEILLGGKGYGGSNDYDKDASQYSRTEDTINSLNAILPDNLESFAEQQSYAVLDSRLQDNNNSMDNVNPHDFSCIDGDMQFFTKSMSDDVKKYYEDQQLNDARVMEQLCPVSNSLDNNFSISLLDTKSSHLSSNLSHQYNSLNSEDLRRNEDCYDFGLQLPQSSVFKEDALDCLMATPKRNDDDESNYQDSSHLDQRAQERDEIIKDLMNIENKMSMAQNHNPTVPDELDINSNTSPDTEMSTVNSLNVSNVFDTDDTQNIKELDTAKINSTELSATITSNGLQWDNLEMNKGPNENDGNGVNAISNDANSENQIDTITTESQFSDSVIDLTRPVGSIKSENNWGDIMTEPEDLNKENENTANSDNINSDLQNDIPFAVGLLPLKQMKPTEEGSLLKRDNLPDDMLNVDAKCLKRKVKYKKL